MVPMVTYEAWSIVDGGYVPSGRYGTTEAIKQRFPNSRFIDAPPVEVDEKDFDYDWQGFARPGFKP